MNKNSIHNKRTKLNNLAHKLKPTVTVGYKGITQEVLKEINFTIKAHELIKLKIHGKEKSDRLQIIETICKDIKCQLIQQIGKTCVIYKEREDNLTEQSYL
ncbi:YhbY family RNA-binding protein [Candidatus Kinetoplastidibacterium crithidiae]|uniref:Putative RNA-binding protein containing KH domain n=1 Tax=Candidatus Kinetoplastidibacterium crithidiae TCC036E TaxID=1208918 RepID=M1LW03_9PROT|nr:YhbY family RNA-binding protein [Candidatus Kinetoplastibacterium crithidii]AGF47439.1 putative RNA-binding protein containing KH domain [Candidatus Kinetoplastibacterium crithidii TCC036E]